MMNLSHSARLLFIGLITQADDDGKGTADARKLKSVIFGGDDVTLAEVKGWLAEIETQRLAVLYEVEGYGDLYLLPSWKLHQYVQKRQPSRYPDPVDNLLPERYRNGNGMLPGDRKGSDMDRKGSDARAKGGRAPGLEAGASASAQGEASAGALALDSDQARANLVKLRAALAS